VSEDVWALKPLRLPWKVSQESDEWRHALQKCVEGEIVFVRVYQRAYFSGHKYNCLMYPGRKRNNYTVYLRDLNIVSRLGFILKFVVVLTQTENVRKMFALAELRPFGKLLHHAAHWKVFAEPSDDERVILAPISSITSRMVCCRVLHAGKRLAWVTRHLRDLNRAAAQVRQPSSHSDIAHSAVISDAERLEFHRCKKCTFIITL
jgi:hypothetical protein